MIHPIRKHPAHHPPVERFNQSVVLHVTICVKDRRKLLANPQSVEAIKSAWGKAVQWRVGHYLVMPDHVHLFCVPGVMHPEPVVRWAGYWKRLASVNDQRLRNQWLRGVWDTQMRSYTHYVEKRCYMLMNPVRAGLVERSEDWPYAGCMCDIIW